MAIMHRHNVAALCPCVLNKFIFYNLFFIRRIFNEKVCKKCHNRTGYLSDGGAKASKGKALKANPATDFKYDFNEDNETLYIKGYKGTSTTVVIPAEIEGMKVTKIIWLSDSVETVVIPEGVTEINMPGILPGAFRDVKSLKSVQLPSTLEKIGEQTFTHTGIEKIVIPESVKEIPDYAFTGCDNLVSVVLPDTLEIIGYGAFSGCDSLTDINIPAGIKEIRNNAFAGSPLTNITIPDSLQSIKFVFDSKYYPMEHFIRSQPPLLIRKRLQELGYTGKF